MIVDKDSRWQSNDNTNVRGGRTSTQIGNTNFFTALLILSQTRPFKWPSSRVQLSRYSTQFRVAALRFVFQNFRHQSETSMRCQDTRSRNFQTHSQTRSRSTFLLVSTSRSSHSSFALNHCGLQKLDPRHPPALDRTGVVRGHYAEFRSNLPVLDSRHGLRCSLTGEEKVEAKR